MSEDTKISFSTAVDLDIEKKGLLAFYAELIKAGRQLPPRITFYHRDKAIISVTSRSFEHGNILDRNRSIIDILYLVPAIQPDLAIVAFSDPVNFTTGTQDAMIFLAVNNSGALAEVFPWFIDDNDDFKFDDEAALAPGSDGVYSEQIAHMLPVFFTAKDSPFPPSDVLGYLSETGHEINLYGDWSIDNIDSKVDMFM